MSPPAGVRDEAPPHAELAVRFAEARARVAGVVHRTPVVTSRTFDQRTGATLHLKCENLQRMGAFKFRGAWNVISQLDAAAQARGVVAYSSGNHAQAVALAARELGVHATIVMPSTAPATKIAATRGYGAEVLFHDQHGVPREALAESLARERGATLVPPFDSVELIAGQATAAAELIEEAGPLDLLVAPVGGGGLLSGTALAARCMLGETCRVFGAEPAAADDAARSLATGTLQRCEHPDTIADGARTPSLSPLTFALIRRYAEGIVTVEETQIATAVGVALQYLKLVTEPTGALALAAVLEGRLATAGRRVGIILSGGNIDPAALLGHALG